MSELRLQVNGRERTVDVDPATPLAYVLRNQLGLTGVKVGCGLEQCGACAVLVDGESVHTCVAPAGQFAGRSIVTVEGLVENGEPGPVQRAFVEAGAAQCGYCTPGLVVAVTALLARVPDPDDTAIRTALSPHLCRCGSHAQVMAAVRALVSGTRSGRVGG
ncbi:MAG: (2Fe-2S)-binding protein [Ectothiorhodospiraceae bacterium]|nr:(2Fe-2S)-binding protein [Ectothiorhodospiraceae bacterium]